MSVEEKNINGGGGSSGSLAEDAGSSSSSSAAGGMSMTFQPDVTLICKGRSFACHEGVLAACSDVFRKMIYLVHAKKGAAATLKTIKVNDVEPDILEMMLSFLYRNRLTGAKDDEVSFLALSNLLAAVDKYKVTRLRVVCEVMILKQVKRDLTSVRAAVFRHLHGSSEGFQKQMIDLVSKDMEDIAHRMRRPPNWDRLG